MATFPSDCPDCGQPITVAVGQYACGGELVWWESYHCAKCGSAVEADGHGHPPAGLIELFLNQEGRYELWIETTGPDTLRAVKVLRAAAGLSLAEAAD